MDASGCTILAMTTSASAAAAAAAAASASAARRLVLVPATPRREPAGAPLRRYRLARLAVEGREAARAERFSHLKRTYD